MSINYSSLIIVQNTVTIPLPSLDPYRKLLKKYPQTLSCPCSTISILYSTFVSFTPRYNEVCKSRFVSTDWIDTIKRPQVPSSYYFEMLAILCTLSNETIHNALNEAGVTQLISSTIQTEQSIETES
ncbi:unnamed protein product [Didymodactylos carnosus]|uniref:Uncharacterized protein n=1 Tax=Didymodactylos carnosus TaxID=1234261 RepID=A0A815VTP4_9BILA|nr:unnamed protein product [Didymodactylos carnosus]CAF4394368.1 unnamed protein product [Didymodactylos carnosus]